MRAISYLRNHAFGAVVIATCLILSAGSGAVAARMVTGQQIKNGTVTSVDIKNDNLRSRDIKNGQVSLPDLAPKVATRAYATSKEDFGLDAAGLPKVVLSLDLPRGSYLVFAKAFAEKVVDDELDVFCGLRDGDDGDLFDASTYLDRTRTTLTGRGPSVESLSNQAALQQASPGTVALVCAGEDVGLEAIKLSALRVSEVTVTP